MRVLEVTDLKLEHPDRTHRLRLYRERNEKNHSPLQVEVSPVSVSPHVWLPGDLYTPVCGIEPSYPVRSCALHPCVRELGTVLCALAVVVVVVSPHPFLLPPIRPSALSSSPV